MGVFSGIKRKFSGGGVKVTLTAPPQLTPDMQVLPGGVEIVAADEGFPVEHVRVRLIAEIETIRRGVDETNSHQQVTLSELHLDGFEIAPGETKQLSFELPVGSNVFDLRGTGTGIAIGGISLGGDHEVITHKVTAHAKLKGVRDPGDSKKITVSGGAGDGNLLGGVLGRL